MKRCSRCHFVHDVPDWKCPQCGHFPQQRGGITALAPEMAEGGAGFQPEAYASLASLEAGNFWFRARNSLIIWVLSRYFQGVRRFLEIGCGTGYVLSGVATAYPEASLTGSEIFSAGLTYAAKRAGRATLLQMDARDIPFIDEFDVIGAFDVLEHIEEDEQVLTEILRALRPGGGIALTVPQHPWLWSLQDDRACHVRRYRAGELREKVTRVGFQVLFETSFVSLLLPAMIVSRKLQRRSHSDEEVLPELRLPKLLNGLFEGIMNAERQLIRAGIRFPVGGSLLLVARKSEERA